MTNQHIINILFHNLIDYAGLFPPANLSLKDALKTYQNHLNSNHKWMIGPFIIPIERIEEILSYKNSFKNTLSLSILGTKASTEETCIDALKKDTHKLTYFQEKHSDNVMIKGYECQLPSHSLSMDYLSTLQNILAPLPWSIFMEFPCLPKDDNWNTLSDTIQTLSTIHNIGIKLRCGGLFKDAFPTTQQIGRLIKECHQNKVPLKGTAGLHHPIRHYSKTYNTTMHGFLNILYACLYVMTKDNTSDTFNEKLIDILETDNPNSFSFISNEIRFKSKNNHDETFTIDHIKQLRKIGFKSYGCCSIDDPVNDLKKMEWL